LDVALIFDIAALSVGAVVKIFPLVDARIVAIGKAWSYADHNIRRVQKKV